MLEISCEPFATLPDGRTVEKWVFGSPGAVTAEVITLGAALHALRVPDRDGARANVVLGTTSAADLLGDARYFGATVGRYANRIARAELPVAGAVHRLPANQAGGGTLHGGPEGFDNRIWTARPLSRDDRVGVRFELHSPDGDQGFPGALDVTATYSLGASGDLAIDYRATTGAPTVVNLTNHSYFNLAGEGSGPVLDHLLMIEADAYTPVDRHLIPLPGAPQAVAGTPFDFTEPRRIGDRIAEDHPQLRTAGGYDHNWVLRPREGREPRLAAVLSHPPTGRRLECFTTEPGLQVYAGNAFDGGLTGTGGRPYRRFAGVALETQHFPDSPHRPDYPSTLLEPGAEYRSRTEYRFTRLPGPGARAD